MPQEITISDSNYQDFINPVVNGEVKQCGTRPRDYKTHPVGCSFSAPPFDLPLIPESEWQDRLDAKIAAKAQLSDIRNRMGPNGGPIPALSQNGQGFCWAYSSTGATMLLRAIQNEPYVELSAHAIGCQIKNYRDEGGWGLESLEWIAKNGVPSSEFWPLQSMSRKNDTPQMRENAKLHRVTEWMDCQPRNKAQLVTGLLMGLPGYGDYDWWGHSICLMDLVSLKPFRIRILNSWGPEWSDNGAGILEGSKAMPDAFAFARVTTPSYS